MRVWRQLTAVLLMAILTGCAALDSAHFAWPGPGRTNVISVDAKLRHLIMNYGEKGLRVCAEAAPDAFSAFGSSLSAGLGIGGTERKAEAANAFATTAATIERTQTYNLLRESFYRTCERWLSGALTEEQFVTLAARDHRSMVAVLAIEQMTGVVKAPSTIISGPAVSASRAQSEKLLEVLAVYQKERRDADDAANSANDAFVTANVLYPDNDPAAKPICTADPPPTDAAAKTKYDACKAAETTTADTKAVAKAATEREKMVLDQLEVLAAGLSATTKAGTNSVGGLDYDKQKISDVKMALIAQSVERIALTAGIDESLMFCTTYLQAREFNPTDSTRAMCDKVVAVRALQDNRVTADITGADAAEISEVLALAVEPSVRAAAREREARYRVFRLGFQMVLHRTGEAKWAERWGAFATATGASSLECTSLTACRDYFAQADSNPFFGRYMTGADKFDEALRAWQAALDNAVADDQQGEQR